MINISVELPGFRGSSGSSGDGQVGQVFSSQVIVSLGNEEDK